MPDLLKKLTYDDYQAIRFLPEKGPWQDEKLPFTFQFFHPGFLYQDQVLIHLLEDGQLTDFRFSPADFMYRTNFPAYSVPADLHFAGLRILYPVNRATKQDEVASFVGASYFRLLGGGQRYGASARALAIDTAEPTGEEFPRFTEFWVEKPKPRAKTLKFYALLNSPSATGAYQFILKPGKVTVLEVDASVYLRKEVRKLGLEPLTSMFLIGANRSRYVPDYRPEIHDSDGLLFALPTGERQWRPLVNPEKTFQVSYFPGENLKGFGLLQRRRDFCRYEDLGARYELRPNLWVKPKTPRGPGTLELVEIPTPNEYNDNIVAYWVPKEKAAAGRQFHVSYLVSASLDGPPGAPLFVVRSTLLDPPRNKKLPRFLIDFVGSNGSPTPAGAVPAAHVKPSRGQILNLVVQTNDAAGGWRVFFDLAAPGDDPVDLRATLSTGEEVVSEAWIYHWKP